MEGGKHFLSNQETVTNGCEGWHNHGQDLTKGEFLPHQLVSDPSMQSEAGFSENQPGPSIHKFGRQI